MPFWNKKEHWKVHSRSREVHCSRLLLRRHKNVYWVKVGILCRNKTFLRANGPVFVWRSNFWQIPFRPPICFVWARFDAEDHLWVLSGVSYFGMHEFDPLWKIGEVFRSKLPFQTQYSRLQILKQIRVHLGAFKRKCGSRHINSQRLRGALCWWPHF